MALPAGTYRLGPDDGTLSLRTGRTGAVAKAGHDLLIHVTAWEARVEVGEGAGDVSIALDVDGASLRVREGTGGMKALGEDDKASITKTIDDEILRRQGITFRSTRVEPGGAGALAVQGDLTILGTTRPIAFDLTAGDGRLQAVTVVRQTEWGIKPYSALFGALKVADEVEVRMEAALPAS